MGTSVLSCFVFSRVHVTFLSVLNAEGKQRHESTLTWLLPPHADGRVIENNGGEVGSSLWETS